MFEALFSFLDGVILNNVATMVGRFTGAITPILGACVMGYIVYLSYVMMLDRQKLVAVEAIKTIASLSLVTGVALNTSWYMSNIVPAILGSGDQITEALLGTGSGSGTALQSVFDRIWDDIASLSNYVAFELDSDVLVKTAEVIGMMIVCVVGFVPFIAIATAYLLMAKIMVSFLLIIGPLFIMFAFFPSTRSFFQAWTGQCFNYVLLSILYPVAFSMITALLNETVFSGNITLVNLLFTTVIFFALCIISTQIPVLSSTLSGGIGISGLIGNVAAGVGAMKSSAGAVAKAPGATKRGVGKTMEKAKSFGKPKIKGG